MTGSLVENSEEPLVATSPRPCAIQSQRLTFSGSLYLVKARFPARVVMIFLT